MSGQNWRTEVDAADHFGHQKKRVELEQRRPVIRKAADLVGPGIGVGAVRITDYNDVLATFNGYYSSLPGALNSPPGDEPFVGNVVSDPVLGGSQTFVGLRSAFEYTRTFVRNVTDATAISWGDWVATERVPASATAREPFGTSVSGQGPQPLRPPLLDTIGAETYSRSKSDVLLLRPGVYAGYVHLVAPPALALSVLLSTPDRGTTKTLLFGPLRGRNLTPIPFTFWTTGESTEIRVSIKHTNATPQDVVWQDFSIVRLGDIGNFDLGFPETVGGEVIPPGGDPEIPDDSGYDDLADPVWEDNDTHTLTSGEVAAGEFTHRLAHPKVVADHEFVAYVNGVALGRNRYNLNPEVGRVDVTLGGWETPEDSFRFHYAYREDTATLPINYGEEWLYTVHPTYDLALMQPGYDDSSWETGIAPFGNQMDDTTDIGGTPSPVGLVVRRYFSSSGGDLHFYTDHWDDNMRVHIDGVEVISEVSYDPPNDAVNVGPLDVTIPVSAGRHLLAVYNTSDIAGGNNSWDLTVKEVPDGE